MMISLLSTYLETAVMNIYAAEITGGVKHK